jgi:hypothetical protein
MKESGRIAAAGTRRLGRISFGIAERQMVPSRESDQGAATDEDPVSNHAFAERCVDGGYQRRLSAAWFSNEANRPNAMTTREILKIFPFHRFARSDPHCRRRAPARWRLLVHRRGRRFSVIGTKLDRIVLQIALSRFRYLAFRTKAKNRRRVHQAHPMPVIDTLSRNA